MNNGAYFTGEYPNFLEEVGISREQSVQRIEQAFRTIFFDPEEGFCHHTDEDAWCMVDTGNQDARTEGMSYGMMMCVQMNRKDIFDRLWTFCERYMLIRKAPTRDILSGRPGWTGPRTRTDRRRTGRSILPWLF